MNYSQIIELYDRFEISLNLSNENKNPSLQTNSVWKEIQSLEKIDREKVSLIALKKLLDPARGEYYSEVVKRKVFRSEFNAKDTPTRGSLIEVLELLPTASYIYLIPFKEVLFCFKSYKNRYGRDEIYMNSRNALMQQWKENKFPSPEFKSFISGLTKLDQSSKNTLVYEHRDILGALLNERWTSYKNEFKGVIEHCWLLPQKSKPSKSWERSTKKMINEAGDLSYQLKEITFIFEFIITVGKALTHRLNSLIVSPPLLEFPYRDPDCQATKAIHDFHDNRHKYYLLEENEIGISYLIWYACTINDSNLNAVIGELAISSFAKGRWIGSLCTKNGNACLYGFTLMPLKVGVTNLLNIRNKTNNKNIKKLADNHIKRKARELKLTEEALLELSAPTFDLVGNLSKSKFEHYTAVIDISALKKPLIHWVNNKTDKIQKSVPQFVRENLTDELKGFKTKIKDLKTAIQIHSKRLENTYINNIEWSIADWKMYYLDHPLLSRYTSRLIWLFDERITAIWHDSIMINENGKIVDISQCSKVKLWHPIYATADQTSAWRTFILDNSILQPFKQAFREIYIVTEAEINSSTYSNRFASHILHQYQFTALAKSREWSYSLQGGFDSHNTPTKIIPKYELRIEYGVEAVQNSLNETNIYNYVASNQVRIYNSRDVIRMQDIPNLVFSE